MQMVKLDTIRTNLTTTKVTNILAEIQLFIGLEEDCMAIEIRII